jgi:hypothetical protein
VFDSKAVLPCFLVVYTIWILARSLHPLKVFNIDIVVQSCSTSTNLNTCRINKQS